MEKHHSNKRDGPSPSPARSAKRLKQPISNETLHLPAEMWAAVMDHLDFSSVLSMTATSQTMNDAASYVAELHVEKTCQMHGSVGRRFADVKRVFIHNLVRQRTIEDSDEDSDGSVGDEIFSVDFDTSMRAVPFISTFTNLEKCCFGGLNGTDDYYFYNVFRLFDHPDYLQRLIDNFSFGFQCGTLSPSLQVTGLCCISGMYNPCQSCVRACRSFPVQAVSQFVHDEASKHNLKVCIKREALANILKSRHGGEESLRSPYHLFRQLAKCKRHSLCSQNGKKLWLVTMAECNEADLEYELNQSGLDKAKLDSSQISAAIMKSFKTNRTDFHILSDRLDRTFANLGLEVCAEVFVPKSRRQDIARDFLPSTRKNSLSILLQHSPSLLEEGLNHDAKLFGSAVIPELMLHLKNPPGPNTSCHLRILSKLTNTSITSVATWDDIIPKDFFSERNKAGNDASAAINNKTITVKEMVDTNTIDGELQNIKLDSTVRLSSPTFYQLQFNLSRYGFNMLYLHGRPIVKESRESGTKVGAIIVAINSQVLSKEPFNDVQRRMRSAILSPGSVVLTFVEDSEFIELITKEIIPRFEKKTKSKLLAAQKDTDR